MPPQAPMVGQDGGVGEVSNQITGDISGVVIQARDVRLRALPAPTALAGLPADEGFAGRSGDLAVLEGALTPDNGRTGSAVVCTIAGLPGSGKTALAVKAARDAVAAGWFPGGVLFLDLHGYDDQTSLDASSALAGLLRALGVPTERIPPGQDERETLYRSRLAELAEAGRRVLVLADNASELDGVLALRPGSAQHRLLVTSRHNLPVPGARRIELGVLSPVDAVAVVAQALDTARPGDARITDEPDATAALVSLCGYLPLALRIAAELLADQPQRPIADWVTILAHTRDRLDELAYGDSVGVQVAFDASYRHLPSKQARVFRLVALHPGPDVAVGAVSAVTELSEPAARRAVEGLRRAHLLQPVTVPGRYGFHDLMRLYALRRLEADQPQNERTAAVGRLLDYYRDAIAAASTYLNPAVTIDDWSARFSDRASALAWLTSELPNFVPVIMLAGETGRDSHIRDMALALLYFFDLRKHWDEWITAGECALSATRRLGDRQGECDALVNLGIAFRQLRRFTEARDYFEHASAIRRDGRILTYLGNALADLRLYDQALITQRDALSTCQQDIDRYGEGMVRGNLGNIFRIMRQWPDALDNYHKAQSISQSVGDRYGEAVIMNNIGLTYRSMRQWQDAADHYQQALVIREEVGDRYGQGMTLTNLGSIHQHLRQFDDALACHLRALAIRREVGDRYGEAVTLSNLGTTYRHLRRWDTAIECYQQALPIRQETNDPFGEGVTQTRLGETCLRLGHRAEALDHYQRALAAFRRANASPAVNQTLARIATDFHD